MVSVEIEVVIYVDFEVDYSMYFWMAGMAVLMNIEVKSLGRFLEGVILLQ